MIEIEKVVFLNKLKIGRDYLYEDQKFFTRFFKFFRFCSVLPVVMRLLLNILFRIPMMDTLSFISTQ